MAFSYSEWGAREQAGTGSGRDFTSLSVFKIEVTVALHHEHAHPIPLDKLCQDVFPVWMTRSTAASISMPISWWRLRQDSP